MLVVKIISSLHLDPTMVTPLHGPSQWIYLTLFPLGSIYTPLLHCPGNWSPLTSRAFQTNHRRTPRLTISAPSLIIILRLTSPRRPQLLAYITLILPRVPMFLSVQPRQRTARPFLASFSAFLLPFLPHRTGRSGP